MKLGPVTKLDKRNKAALKKIGDGVMPKNCDIIVIFPIYGLACNTYIFINSNILC